MLIDFVDDQGAYTGTGEGGRRWKISGVSTGWRLEFRAAGDVTATYAGVHRSAAATQTDRGRRDVHCT
jgi:hypothetical protein